MQSWLQAQGAVFGEVAGRRVARHFGDVLAEYRTAREAAGVAERADLALVRVWGRDPVKMLNGLITNDLNAAAPGQGVYATMLTPKGRTIAELRVLRLERASGVELLLVLPREALAGTREHLKKFVPPLFARWAETSDTHGVLGIYGPRAAACLAAVPGIEAPAPGEDRFAEADFEGHPVVVVRTLDAGLEDGFDLIAPAEALPRLADALLASGPDVSPVGFDALETLRVEAGRPRYGAELTEETIPTEAFEETGLQPRAISFSKGCYTGQEVIVRIAHRGHVNRHLRGLLLGETLPPAPRTPLFHADTGREIGRVTSAVVSPLLGQTVALAFVRREVEPGGTVRVGGTEAAGARVIRLPFSREQAR